MRIRAKNFIRIGLLVFSLMAFFVCSKLYAQEEGFGISVSPPTFEFTANPGNQIEANIRVNNVSNEPLEISVDVRNFIALGEEGAVALTEEGLEYTLASWITVIPDVVSIDSKGKVDFKFTIKIPENAPPGGHFSSIVFRTERNESFETGASVVQEVGVLILLRISGEVKEGIDIESFSTGKNFYEYGPIDFSSRVLNTGNVHIKPKGVITISNIFGKVIATIDVDQKNVLPGSIRKIDSVWDKTNLFGKYNATLSVNYGQAGDIITDSTSFYVFPYRLIIGILVLLIVLLVLVIRSKDRIVLAWRVLSGKDKEIK
jgi:hypothetical protein